MAFPHTKKKACNILKKKKQDFTIHRRIKNLDHKDFAGLNESSYHTTQSDQKSDYLACMGLSEEFVVFKPSWSCDIFDPFKTTALISNQRIEVMDRSTSDPNEAIRSLFR